MYKCIIYYILFNFFLQDFIRVVMICINYFYQGGVNSYLDLYIRISYFYIVFRYMQFYFDFSEWGSVKRFIMLEEFNFSILG